MHIQTRYYQIDTLKAFGIFCIILGHNNYSDIGNYIYSFHIPLFFFVSGLLYNEDRYESFRSFLKKRTQNLLIPYFLISIILFAFWLFAGRKFGASAEMNLSPVKNFIGIFYAQGGNEFMDWGIPMWFLPCLFLVTILYFFISKLKKPFIVMLLIISGVLASIYSKNYNIHLPWSIDIAFAALPFYGTGHLLRKYFSNNIIQHRNKYQFVLILLLSLVLNISFFYLNDRIDMSKGLYNHYLFMYLSGIGGTIFYLLLLSFLPKMSWISYIGVNTLLIMAFHLRAMTVIKFTQIYIFHLEYNYSDAWSIIYSIIQIVILLPLIWFINKYTPLIAGKRRIAKNT